MTKSYDIRFPEHLDGYEAEAEAKGYLVGVVVIADSRTFDLTILTEPAWVRNSMTN